MKQFEMAGGRGFEPLLAESESAVLPLDEPPERVYYNRREEGINLFFWYCRHSGECRNPV